MSFPMVAENWAQRRIGDDCLVGDGIHAKIKRQESGVIYLTSKNFKDGKLDLSKVDYISETDFNKHFKDNSRAKTKPRCGDVVFSIIGSIGEPYLVKADDRFGLSSSVAILRSNQSSLSPKFLYYWIIGSIFQSALYGIKGGVAQGYVSLGMIRSLPLMYPPLPIQRKIAAILSAYDDLIENNTRRIKILEEMAQALYREWFVHFRFPGHEKVRMVDSPLGRIPEGWEVKKLGDITTKIGSGATPRGGKNSYKKTGISLIRSLNVYDFKFDMSGLVFIDFEQAEQLLNVIVEPRDILLNITGASVGRCCIVPSYILPARVNQHVSILRVNSDKSNPLYLLYVINSDYYKELLLGMSRGGATREALTKSTITNFEIIHPPKDLIDKFGHAAEDFFEQQEILKRKNVILSLTRELLLPKLISGYIDISYLDIGGLNEGN